MNKFMFCFETERGIFYGQLKATDGSAAKQILTSYIERNDHKKIIKMEFQGIHSGDIQCDILRHKNPATVLQLIKECHEHGLRNETIPAELLKRIEEEL